MLKIWCKKDIYSQHKCDLAITKDCIGELTILYAIKIYVLWKEWQFVTMLINFIIIGNKHNTFIFTAFFNIQKQATATKRGDKTEAVWLILIF